MSGLPKPRESETRKLLGSRPKPTTSRGITLRIPQEVSEAFARYESSRWKLQHFLQEHERIIEEYNELKREHDIATEDVKTAYSHHRDVLGESYQGFTISKRRSVDAKHLVELMPDLIGHVKYSMAVAEFDELVLNGIIPPDVIPEVIDVKESVSGPKK